MSTIFLIVALLSGAPQSTLNNEEMVQFAIENCKRVRNIDSVDKQMLVRVLAIEDSYNPPKELRGMTLAAACLESGFNPLAKGDRKFSKKRKPKAIGMFQMWKWWEKFYGIKRTDPEQAADAWMRHIIRQIPKVEKKCRYKKDKSIWVAAWVTAIRAPKKEGRCREKPLHLRLLMKWHKKLKKQNDARRQN